MVAPFQKFMGRYGANVAGFLYNIGGIFQFIAGAVLSSPRDIAAALLNFAAASILNFFGHKNAAVVIASLLALVINIMTTYPGLAAGEDSSILGIAFQFVAQGICIFNLQLAKRFGKAKSRGVHATFGRPRRMVGLIQFSLCRLPLLYGNGLHHRWVAVSVFAIWSLADLAFAMSRPTMTTSVPVS